MKIFRELEVNISRTNENIPKINESVRRLMKMF